MFVFIVHNIQWSTPLSFISHFMGVQTQQSEIRKRLGGSTLFVIVEINALGASGQKIGNNK
jgi:hypothetical protein